MKEDRVVDHKKLETKWRGLWEKVKLNEFDLTKTQKPFYNLMMFPYPSAEGLHVGNMYAFTGSDIYGRFMRMQGYDVFEPIGLDGFGIHSENYALKVGRHPMDHAAITEKNFYNQLHKIGAMYDWSRTVETYKPEYYHWTQWLFIQMFKHGLAYRKKALVNWCPGCKTVLADEQVIDGKCERCGNSAEKRPLEQWFFRITAYAEKLLSHIESLDWSEKVKTAQRNWIGKKTGITVVYKIVDNDDRVIGDISCFTTRPDTNFGATFVVLAPEHPFITQILSLLGEKEQEAIRHFVDESKKRSETDRVSVVKDKHGIFCGVYAINDLTGQKMPVYVADYVLITFGTGAVVGVPGHDKRDFLFAKQHNLAITRVVVASDGKDGPVESLADVQEDEGTMVNSGFLNGLDIHQATEKIMDYMEEKGFGKRQSTYHLRDWLISRQRYWGPPIPMIYCQACADKGWSWFSTQEAQGLGRKISGVDSSESAGWFPVYEEDLPVVLPRIEDYKPTGDGKSPLSKHTEFYETVCPHCSGKAVRETDVSDTFLDSSWYFLRYPSVGLSFDSQDDKNFLDPLRASHMTSVETPVTRINRSAKLDTAKLDNRSVKILSSLPQSTNFPWNPEITKQWLPVHMYTGGAEHSVLHLLYSRFVTMALYDMGYIDFDEPFRSFFAHGLVIKDGAKMSKSKGNVINPDEYIETYGCDALRLYLMFMGPFSDGGDFRDASMEGMSRWLKRVWRLVTKSIETSSNSKQDTIQKALHKLIVKVTHDLENRHYNTAIAAMMEFTNLVSDAGGVLTYEQVADFLCMLAPFAVHTTEELWQLLHKKTENDFVKNDSVHMQIWPTAKSQIVDDQVTIVFQVNSKVREVQILTRQQADDRAFLEDLARSSKKIKQFTQDKQVKTVIVVPGKLVNIVV